MGFCIGGPFIWNMLRRAPNRVVAAVLAQPSGGRPEMPDLFYNNNITGWGPPLCARRPDITMEQVDVFLKKMYGANKDFVFTVNRDFVRTCQTPILVLPDDIPAHPYAVAMESAMLAPNSQVSLYPRCAISTASFAPTVRRRPDRSSAEDPRFNKAKETTGGLHRGRSNRLSRPCLF